MTDILDLSQVAQSEKEYDRIIRGQLTNEVIARYYEDMADFSTLDYDYETYQLLSNKAANLRSCHRIMNFKHYAGMGVKDYQSTIYCHDKFCPNCAKLSANTREQKFQKILAGLENDYDFYHMVLTLKNVRGAVPCWKRADIALPELAPYLKTMSSSFKSLTRYFTGNAKIAGLDFSQYGYGGAVRTLEVTFKQIQEYHPHYHALVAMRKGLEFEGKNKNDFSFNKFNNKITLFSHFEILLQKIWYLVLNGERVNMENINNLRQGYSCQFKKVLPKESHDVFKYIVKPDKGAMMTPEVFQDLFVSLKGMRSIQTYGCFHGLKLEDDEIDDSNDAAYDNIIQRLNEIESPTECSESPTSVRDNIAAKKFIYISRRSIRSFIRKMDIEGDEFVLAAPSKVAEMLQSVMPDILNKPTSSLLYLDGGRCVKPRD